MNKDTIFQGREQAKDFAFDDQVAGVFDDMLERSIPFYSEQQAMFRTLAKKFWQPATSIYDLGCSTATTLIGMAADLPEVLSFVGFDNSEPMLEKARQKVAVNNLQDRIDLRMGELNGRLSDLVLENASVVTLCWTLQFIRPLQRDLLIRWIRDALVDGGIMIVAEKVLTHSADTNRVFIDSYYDFKRRNDYSNDEISRKREALENVLVPYRMDENIELFKRNGFEVAETFFQWFNFAGFLCVKSG